MSETEAVLFANEAFYRAFAERDAALMEEVWARDTPVTCIHPGWGPLAGRRAVIESWTAILRNPGAPRIRCRSPAATIIGTAAFVVCFEEIDGQFLIATNCFAREGGVWRMVHHQAGPTSAAPGRPDRPTGTMH
ncbi:MAG: nuclear transport factor 2 family protein [Alphaproteobacteria bacterium]|nr:nuclear transport factor 2 family protein [Alphaproteobacteria bacterium]